MDMLYVEKYWTSGNSTTKLVSTIEHFLNQSQFLTSGELSLADIYAYSLLAKEKGKWPQKVQDWIKRCGDELKFNKGKLILYRTVFDSHFETFQVET